MRGLSKTLLFRQLGRDALDYLTILHLLRLVKNYCDLPLAF